LQLADEKPKSKKNVIIRSGQNYVSNQTESFNDEKKLLKQALVLLVQKNFRIDLSVHEKSFTLNGRDVAVAPPGGIGRPY